MNESRLSPRKTPSQPSRLLRSERGTAIVEFALIAPLLFFLVFGIVEFGRALNYYNDLTQLAGQGARAAVVNHNPDGTPVGTANADCPANNQTIQCQIAKTFPTDGELRDGISVCLGTFTTDANGNPDGSGNIDTTTTPAIREPVTIRTKFKFHFLTSLFGATITLSSTQTELNEAKTTWGGGMVRGAQAQADGVDACTP